MPFRTVRTPTMISRINAWGVHLLTASGAILAVLAVYYIEERRYDLATLAMLAAFLIDAFDGTLARAADVQRHAPQIDGRRLDDMVDFLNYVIVPAIFWVSAGSLSHGAWVVVPVLASCYGFSQVDAKTESDCFLGFPSYWNVVAWYVWLLDVPPVVATAVVVFLSVMVFVPLEYAYPSKMKVLKRTTNGLGLTWVFVLAALVLVPEWSWQRAGVLATLGYPAFYLALSFFPGVLKPKPAA